MQCFHAVFIKKKNTLCILLTLHHNLKLNKFCLYKLTFTFKYQDKYVFRGHFNKKKRQQLVNINK